MKERIADQNRLYVLNWPRLSVDLAAPHFKTWKRKRFGGMRHPCNSKIYLASYHAAVSWDEVVFKNK